MLIKGLAGNFDVSNKHFEFARLWNAAYDAGMAAVAAAKVQPMVVRSGSGQSWFVPDGVCGFAWVTVKPANSPFANWAKKVGLMRSAYGGGVQYWVGEFDQSMQKKEAFADAVAKVLEQGGVKAFSGSRMD